MRGARGAQGCERREGAARSRQTARLAAHAVGPAARPARPLPARHRDRGHRAWARARGALERPDARARISFRSRSIRCWSRPSRGRRWPRSTDRLRLAVLLHDAPEYVIGDMISPFKAVIGDAYKAVESAAARRHPPALRPAADAAGRLTRLIKTADRPRPSGGDAARRLRGRRGARSSAAAETLAGAERDYLTPWTAETRRSALSRTLRALSTLSGWRTPAAGAADIAVRDWTCRP